jgi:hypothetical protein
MDFHQLHKTRVIELREMAAKYGVEGTSALKKEQLVDFLATKLGIDRHAHGKLGINKDAVKKRLREVKAERDAALAAHDDKALKQARRRIHRLNREIRRAVERAARP